MDASINGSIATITGGGGQTCAGIIELHVPEPVQSHVSGRELVQNNVQTSVPGYWHREVVQKHVRAGTKHVRTSVLAPLLLQKQESKWVVGRVERGTRVLQL